MTFLEHAHITMNFPNGLKRYKQVCPTKSTDSIRYTSYICYRAVMPLGELYFIIIGVIIRSYNWTLDHAIRKFYVNIESLHQNCLIDQNVIITSLLYKCIWNRIRSMNLSYNCGHGIEDSDYSGFGQCCFRVPGLNNISFSLTSA